MVIRMSYQIIEAEDVNSDEHNERKRRYTQLFPVGRQFSLEDLVNYVNKDAITCPISEKTYQLSQLHINMNVALKYLSQFTNKATQKTYIQCLRQLFGEGFLVHDYSQLTYDNVLDAIRNAEKGKDKKTRYIRLLLSVVKGITRVARRYKHLKNADEYYDIITMKLTRSAGEPEHYALSNDELMEMRIAILSQKNSIKAARDLALVSIMSMAGLRANECAELTCKSVDFDKQKLHVIGKGKKERTVPIHVELYDILMNWRDVRNTAEDTLHWQDNPAPFFQGMTKYLPKTTRMSQSAIFDICAFPGLTAREILEIRRKVVKAPDKRSSPPHSLRRTFATSAFKQNIELEQIRKWLGHSNIITTQRYIKLSLSEDESQANMSELVFLGE